MVGSATLGAARFLRAFTGVAAFTGVFTFPPRLVALPLAGDAAVTVVQKKCYIFFSAQFVFNCITQLCFMILYPDISNLSVVFCL